MSAPAAFQAAAAELLRESGCTVRKWRAGSSTGTAHTDAADWGIEVPEPRGPISFGTFAHEVAHQMLHRRNGRTPRWVEEVEAEDWALAQFDRFALPGKEQYQARAAKHVAYAFSKARRRGVKATVIRERFPEWWLRALPHVWHHMIEGGRS